MTGLLLLGVAAVLLSVGAEAFAENAAAAGRRLSVSTLAVGLLLAGAEPEELVTAVLAALRDRPGIAVGDAIGANVTLATLVLGALALITPVPLVGRVRTYAVLATVTATVAAAAVVSGAVVTGPEGMVLLVLYVAVVAVLWTRERRPPVFGEVADVADREDAPDLSADRLTRGLVFALGGVATMAAGGWFAVSGAERIVDALELTDTAVGLTLVALATTAEFVALLISTTRRGITEIAVAAVFGSILYNATVTLGAAALVVPLATDTAVVTASVAAAALPVAVIALGGSRRILRRPAAAVLVAGYALYVVTMIR